MELVGRDLARELGSRDFRCAEVMVAPGEMERSRGLRPAQVLDALGRARARVAAELGPELRGILELAIEDPALVAHLAERRIAFDVCPTSNDALGVCPSRAAHPLRRLHEAGVPVTVNSDDPTMFGVTLAQEVAALTARHGLSEAAASEIVRNGFRHGFEAGPP